MGRMVQHYIRTRDDADHRTRAPFQNARSGLAHIEEAALFRCCVSGHHTQLSAVRRWAVIADLPAGVHGLQRLEGRAGYVPALAWWSHGNDLRWPGCAPRLRQQAAYRSELPDRRARALDDVVLESRCRLLANDLDQCPFSGSGSG